MERLAQLKHWLGSLYPDRQIDLAPASADASFRRYFRVHVDGEPASFIAMDAPPDKEDTAPFIRIAKLFGDSGAQVPTVLEANTADGFLLLTDLGDTTYLNALDADNAHALYADALGALICIQKASAPGVLPDYDRERLRAEMQLFPDWYLARHKHITLDDSEQKILDTVFERLLEANLAEPKVFVHRDFHSRNLMVTEHGAGVLDFQDAVYGPITYDAASLLRDAFLSWDEEQELDWAVRYWEAARAAKLPVDADFGEFYRALEWMGAQRHLKVAGIFARLCYRDGKAGYVEDTPRFIAYLRRVCSRYNALAPLARLLDQLEDRAQQVGYTF